MEQLNQITLRGYVGAIKETEIAGKTLTNIMLSTSRVYKGGMGEPVIETTWHQIKYWGKTELKKGDKAEIIGRIHQTKYATANGDNVNTYEVIADIVLKLDVPINVPMEYEGKRTLLSTNDKEENNN